jgi:hypothetical protein
VANVYIAAKAASGQTQAAEAASVAEGVLSNQAGSVMWSLAFHAVHHAGMTQAEPAPLVEQQLTNDAGHSDINIMIRWTCNSKVHVMTL